MCNQHVTNHSSDHTVRFILKETTKHNIHWPLDEDITNAEPVSYTHLCAALTAKCPSRSRSSSRLPHRSPSRRIHRKIRSRPISRNTDRCCLLYTSRCV